MAKIILGLKIKFFLKRILLGLLGSVLLVLVSCGGGSSTVTLAELTSNFESDTDKLNAPIVYTGTPPWFAYDRTTLTQAVNSEILIPMSSGGSLFCDLINPSANGAQIAPGKFPTYIVGFTPYSSLFAVSLAQGLFFAQRGYNVVKCDVRGTGRSVATTGESYSVWASPKELQDEYDVIEWAAIQPWSDSRVVVSGGSYGGQSTQRLLLKKPPHLVAIAPQFQAVGYSEEGNGFIYSGGAARSNLTVWSTVACGVIGVGCNPAAVIQNFLDHPLYDDYWKQNDASQTWVNADLPIFSNGSTTDSAMIGGTFENYVGLRKAGKPNNYLVAGAYGHGGPPQNTQLLFFDRHLFGFPTAVMPTPVTVQEGGAGTQAWYGFSDWPPVDSRSLQLNLTAAGTLSDTSGNSSTANYNVPANAQSTAVPPVCGPVICDIAPVPTVPVPSDQKLVFDSVIFANDVVLSGRPTFHLKSSISATDTIFVVAISDVAPDGSAKQIQTSPAYFKTSHRDSHKFLSKIVPGELNEYNFPGYHNLYRIVKGHKLRVEIRGSDSGLHESAPAGNVVIATGQGGSFIKLQVRQ